MNQPGRREVERFIHVDSRDFPELTNSSYNIIFGKDIPIQDYNNVVKLELKAFMSDKPDNEDYVLFKIKNVDGKVDTTTGVVDACTVCYFDPTTVGVKKPIYFGGTEFEFNPPIAKLSKLQIDVVKHDGSFCDINSNHIINEQYQTQSFLLKITYIEGNLY